MNTSAKTKDRALKPCPRCMNCFECGGDGVVESTESARKVDMPAAQIALKECYLALGVTDREATIAAGLDEPMIGDVRVSDLLQR
jgi:hypothetical protein